MITVKRIVYYVYRGMNCYDFSMKTMFGSSLPPVVCGSARILFMLFVFACV